MEESASNIGITALCRSMLQNEKQSRKTLNSSDLLERGHTLAKKLYSGKHWRQTYIINKLQIIFNIYNPGQKYFKQSKKNRVRPDRTRKFWYLFLHFFFAVIAKVLYLEGRLGTSFVCKQYLAYWPFRYFVFINVDIKLKIFFWVTYTFIIQIMFYGILDSP